MTPSDPTELEALWRGDPAFIGPVAPPMVLWLRRGSPKDAWQIAVDKRAALRSAPKQPEQLAFDFDDAA